MVKVKIDRMKLIPKEKWVKAITDEFMKNMKKWRAKMSEETREYLLKGFRQSLLRLDEQSSGMENLIWLSANSTSLEVMVSTPYEPYSFKGTTESVDRYELARLTKGDRKPVTRPVFNEWFYNAVDTAGRKLSKEVLRGNYFDEFYNRFAISRCKLDDFLESQAKKKEFEIGVAKRDIDYILSEPKIRSIRQATGNSKKNTFDFVEVEVSFLSVIDKKEASDIIKKNLKKVINSCIAMLKSSSKYKAYGVPVRHLKVGKMVVTNDHYFVVTFELAGAKKFEQTKLFG